MTHKVCLPQDTQLQQPVLLGRICLAPLGLGQPSMAAAHASPPAFPSTTAPQIRLRGSCGAEIAIINLLCFAQRMRRKTIAFRGDHAKNNRAEAACPALEEPCGPGVCAGGSGCRCSEATVQLLSTWYISYGYVTNNVFLRETMTLRKKP